MAAVDIAGARPLGRFTLRISDHIGIHPTFAPTMNIRAGDPVTFKVRSFRTTFGSETWDFGDGSEKVTVKSDGNVEQHAKDGYAVTQHRFAKPGHYVVRVERSNERDQRALGHLHVPVEVEVGNRGVAK